MLRHAQVQSGASIGKLLAAAQKGQSDLRALLDECVSSFCHDRSSEGERHKSLLGALRDACFEVLALLYRRHQLAHGDPTC